MNSPQDIYDVLSAGDYTEEAPYVCFTSNEQTQLSLRDSLRVLAGGDGFFLGSYGSGDYLRLDVWLYLPPPPPDPPPSSPPPLPPVDESPTSVKSRFLSRFRR